MVARRQTGEQSGSRESAGARRGLPALIGVCALLAGLLAGAVPASALPQRGHEFAFSFASKGTSAGRLLHPAGVAVNEATGDVYVVDAANNRVERFSSTGEFISAWGWGVSDGNGEAQICTSGCVAGIAGEGLGQFDAPEAIAVDNSTNPEDPSRGDLYVLSDTTAANNTVQKFAPDGTPLSKLQFPNEDTGGIGGVSVDSAGKLWVSDIGRSEVLAFNNALLNQAAPEAISLQLECAETQGFAVDAQSAAFYLSHQRENGEEECPEVPASAKAPALIAKLSANGELLGNALGEQNASGVAVDLASSEASPLGLAARGDVYLDNQTSLAAYSSDGAFIQRFGAGEQLSQGSGIAINASSGNVYVADAKADEVDVFSPESPGAPSVDALSFSNRSTSSTRLEAQIDPHGSDTHYYFQYGTADCQTSPSSCTDVTIPPGQDIGTGFGARPASAVASPLQPGRSYFYRVIASNADGQAEGSQTLSSFTTLPSSVDVLPDDRSWELVSPPEKHGALIYPIGGSTESSAPGLGVIQASADGAQITYAANAPIGEGSAGNRAPEATQALSRRGPESWSTEDIVTPHEHPEGIVPTNIPQEYRAFSEDLSAALVQPFGGFGNRFQEPPLVQGLQQEEHGIYVRQNSSCQAGLASCYEPLLSSSDVSSAAQFGGEVETLAATPDLRHVLFSSDVPLSSALPSGSGLYEYNADRSGPEALQLISVLPGNKKSVQEPEPQLGDLNPGISTARDSISDDGSRVFWSAVIEKGSSSVTRLFMRDTRAQKTIQINAAQGVKEAHGEEAEKEEVHFRTASTDGSMVFFTDNFALTAASKLKPEAGGPADLYVCEVLEGPEGPECKLTDLTVNQREESSESADVVGALPGASDDGSFVYFVANGVLSAQAEADGAKPGSCVRPSASSNAQASAKCNLYVVHYDAQSKQWQAPKFIASLSQEDSPDWGSSGSLSLGSLTSRVSPNGQYLAFMSDQSLTGYDNRDASPAANGALDEEVFVYSAEDGRLICASCDPSGAPPHGILDRERTGEGKGLLVDRFGVWQQSQAEELGAQPRALAHWLAGSIPGWTSLDAYTALYQSRYLTDQGRLFFNSPDALVAHDSNAKEDVYEFEPEGVGSCESSPGCIALISSGEADHESAFLDASESGNDAFILTNRQLVAGDHDTNFDVYDAHVCSSASPCLPAPSSSQQPCESSQTCQPVSVSSPVFPGASGSAIFSGPGNLSETPGTAVKGSQTAKKPLTRAQLLAKALKACKKKYKGKHKAKRTACERQARKRYGSKKSRRRASGSHKPAKRGKS